MLNRTGSHFRSYNYNITSGWPFRSYSGDICCIRPPNQNQALAEFSEQLRRAAAVVSSVMEFFPRSVYVITWQADQCSRPLTGWAGEMGDDPTPVHRDHAEVSGCTRQDIITLGSDFDQTNQDL